MWVGYISYGGLHSTTWQKYMAVILTGLARLIICNRYLLYYSLLLPRVLFPQTCLIYACVWLLINGQVYHNCLQYFSIRNAVAIPSHLSVLGCDPSHWVKQPKKMAQVPGSLTSMSET